MNTIPRNEHPRPDRRRDTWLSLNGTWDFEIDNAKVGEGKKFFERASLDGKITVPFCPESRLSGVAHTDFMNAVWYRRDLDIPADWAGKNVILHIDACDYETTVFVNGSTLFYKYLKKARGSNFLKEIVTAEKLKYLVEILVVLVGQGY